jgi:cyclopropane fatty-acyl-phospholipid synthase-like methyltransferase
LSQDVGLEVEQVETFGPDYARTLAAWKKAFDQSWSRLHGPHQLDERFRRMWGLYLILCQAGFVMGRINVEQWVFRKPLLGANLRQQRNEMEAGRPQSAIL